MAAALLAVTFYPLAFVPFGVTAPALGVLALGLGLMACDGLLILIGYVLSAVTAYVLFASLSPSAVQLAKRPPRLLVRTLATGAFNAAPDDGRRRAVAGQASWSGVPRATRKVRMLWRLIPHHNLSGGPLDDSRL